MMPTSLYEERGNPFDPGGGCGTLDGLPISCSELRMRMQGGSVEASYPGLHERDPNQPWGDPRPPRTVTPTRPIADYGVGLYGIWMPSVFQMDRSGPGLSFFTVPQKTSLPTDLKQQVQNTVTNCADYMNRLLNQLGSKYTAETFGDLFDRVGMDRIKIDHEVFVEAGEPTAPGLAKYDPRRIYINTGVTGFAKVTTFELLHHAANRGSFDDHEIDKAVIKLMEPEKRAKAERERAGKDGPYKRATIAHRELNRNCFNPGRQQ
jgi:hypothetical protein